MFFLSRFKISSQMALTLVAPVIAILLLAGLSVNEQRNRVAELSNLEDLSVLAGQISKAVHELQKERGRSAGYLGSNGTSMATELQQQYKGTDPTTNELTRALRDFNAAALGESLADKVQLAQRALNQLNSVRVEVTDLNLTTPQMVNYYTGAISDLLNIISEMAVISTDAEISK